ncbi:MAG: phosphatase PAP2 family protein [Pseudomonadota bacterium]
MRSARNGMILAAAVAIGACATAAAPVSTSPAAMQAPANASSGAAASTAASGSYLAADAVDMFAVMPPAPRAGEAQYENDRRIFRDTRALEGTARWKMAADDADLSTPNLLKHFSCSMGIELTPQQAPRMVAMLQKATRDASRVAGKAKDYYKRDRPFFIDNGPLCVDRSTVAGSYDYPSGHTTAGWSWALVLAQVAPEHANAIFARGRAIGDSRIVCGMHNASAVSAARLATSATLDLVMVTPEYQADLAAARAELSALRASPHATPDPARCEQEVALEKIP